MEKSAVLVQTALNLGHELQHVAIGRKLQKTDYPQAIAGVKAWKGNGGKYSAIRMFQTAAAIQFDMDYGAANTNGQTDYAKAFIKYVERPAVDAELMIYNELTQAGVDTTKTETDLRANGNILAGDALDQKLLTTYKLITDDLGPQGISAAADIVKDHKTPAMVAEFTKQKLIGPDQTAETKRLLFLAFGDRGLMPEDK